jgi:hypothetical protein
MNDPAFQLVVAVSPARLFILWFQIKHQIFTTCAKRNQNDNKTINYNSVRNRDDLWISTVLSL